MESGRYFVCFDGIYGCDRMEDEYILDKNVNVCFFGGDFGV